MKIFRRENILILLLIIGAALGIVGIPQKIGITVEQLLLALLGVLALDTLIERLGYLERIEDQITKLQDKFESKVSADNLFHTRPELPLITLWLTQFDEIWFSGINLYTLVHAYGRQIEQAAKNGKRFRFVLANPDNNSLWDAIATRSFTQPDKVAQRQLPIDTLALFSHILENVPRNSIEIRLADYDFTCSYVIGDGNKSRGKIVVEFFNYKIATGERQHMLLSKEVEPVQFDFHFQQYESIWKDAKPISELKPKE